MPRYAQLLPVLLTLVAAPAFAQISFDGSVQPVGPSGFPILGTPDANNDGSFDFLVAGGNSIITDGVGLDPTGGGGASVAWHSGLVWRSYDSTQNIIVGDSGGSGSLSINAGGNLRYQHLVIGGVSETFAASGGVPLDISRNDFTLTDQENMVQRHLSFIDPGRGGSGVVNVTGAGSLYSNDPNLIPFDNQIALNLGAGTNEVITDLDAHVDLTGYPFALFNTREDEIGYDVAVGLNGSGVLNVTQGGRVEIQDALMVGVDDSSVGIVVVDGAGSTIEAFGREEYDVTGNTTTITYSDETASFIGGRGSATMTVSNGGSGTFHNGLSIGAPTADIAAVTALAVDGAGRGSGTLTVTGAGSVVTAHASRQGVLTAGSDTALTSPNLALAVGSLRATLVDPFDPTGADANMQSGTLNIIDGAIVNTTFTDFGPARTAEDADMAIGKLGEVSLANGTLNVGDELLNDGLIIGHGTVNARVLATSVFSRIRGGDPDDLQGESTDPLRLILNENPAADEAAFTNRGLVSGQVEIQATGAIDNRGTVEIGGDISASSLVTTSESRIIGSRGPNNPIRINLYNTDAAGDANPDFDSADGHFGSLHNRGLIGGSIDIVTEGGVVNGDNYLPIGSAPANGSTVGGTIAANGRILAGTFLNNVDAEVRVGAGESLAIHVNADTSTTFPSGAGIPVVGGGDLAYRSFNLGSISVTDGVLEIGYLPADSAPVDFIAAGGGYNSLEIFTNGRYVVQDATPTDIAESHTGTITLNGGQLSLTTGLINVGVMAITGGDNLINGQVFNTRIDYDSTDTDPLTNPNLIFDGAIVVSGNGTTATFEDNVSNDGVISIGPFDNVVNFLSDLDATGPNGTGIVQLTTDGLTSANESAYITVGQTVQINGGSLVVASLTAGPTPTPGTSIALITAGELTEDSLFTDLTLPELGENQFWDVIYDTAGDEVRLEVVESLAFGADFTGDGIVTQDDVDVWIRNAGIESGASVIMGDADLDGDVDLSDYDLLMAQLFTGVPVAVGGGPLALANAVPEPATALLALLATAAAASRRR